MGTFLVNGFKNSATLAAKTRVVHMDANRITLGATAR
jgi:hypothetical protein